jgi:hypothetical protein
MISITCKVLCSVVDALVHSHETIFSSGVLTALQVRAHIWQHSSDTLLVFGHMSANFRTYFKNKSVLETLQSARSIRTTLSAVVNAHHVNNSHQSSTRCEVKSILNFRKDTFSNANSYFIITSLNSPIHSCTLLSGKLLTGMDLK